MARKSLGGMSGIANTIARSGGAADKVAAKPKPSSKSAPPALGALQGSLVAIREIDPALIDDWGPVDRLDAFTAVNSVDDGDGFDALKDSMRDGGQQVPILVRRAAREGRYEVIYGRRRLKACRDLGIKVRANVQDLDDASALLAKGLENAARRNLSFYEKARFAQAIQEAGHDNATIRQVLSLSKSGLSHLTKVTQIVPKAAGDLIGAAPKSGRPKWTALAERFSAGYLDEQGACDVLTEQGADLPSDERLDLLLRVVSKTRNAPPSQTEVTPVEGVSIKTGRTGLSLSAKKSGPNADFVMWLEGNLAEMIQKSYAEFTAVNARQDGDN